MTMTSQLIQALEYIFPGILSILILRLLTTIRAEGILLVVYAFVLTLAVQFILKLIEKAFPPELLWNSNWEYEILVSIAIILALILAPLWEKDVLHSILRKCRITKRSAHNSAKYSAFSRRNDCYVILHIDGRRLFGWPSEWPSWQEDEYILLDESEWIIDDDTKKEQQNNELNSASHMLIPMSKIDLIEFVIGKKEQS